MMKNKSLFRFALMICVAGAMVLAGCDNPPRGKASGRVDITTTTAEERDSQKLLPVALIEFSDQVPAKLFQELSVLPQIKDATDRVTIIMGDIDNRTRIVPTSDFQVAAARIRNNLLTSPVGRSNFKFVERRARMTDLAARERVASAGELADPADYDPQTTYTLNGDFFRISRGETNYYYMEFQLVHFATNEIVFANRYEVKQVTP